MSLGYFFIINQIRSQLTRKVLDLNDKLFFIQPLSILAEVTSSEPLSMARQYGTLRLGYTYFHSNKLFGTTRLTRAFKDTKTAQKYAVLIVR